MLNFYSWGILHRAISNVDKLYESCLNKTLKINRFECRTLSITKLLKEHFNINSKIEMRIGPFWSVQILSESEDDLLYEPMSHLTSNKNFINFLIYIL